MKVIVPVFYLYNRSLREYPDFGLLTLGPSNGRLVFKRARDWIRALREGELLGSEFDFWNPEEPIVTVLRSPREQIITVAAKE